MANYVLIFALFSPILTFVTNELIKREEIKQVFFKCISTMLNFISFRVNLRYQKRARLDFGTKLGMNSPF